MTLTPLASAPPASAPAPAGPAAPAAPASPVRRLGPGLALALVAGSAAWGASQLTPLASPLLVSILLGMAVGALRPPSARTAPGLAVASRRLLRVGIVLLGLRLSLGEVTALGPGVLLLIVLVVGSGIAVTLAAGRLLGLSWTQRLLIAGGFSICGAAAVAALDGVVESREEETATAVAAVVLYGTAMIAAVPPLATLLGLGDRAAGIWAGASIHEVAQVVAAGGLIGGTALSVAVVVKLGRVMMLAPVLAWVGWHERRRLRTTGSTMTLPPLVPGFVVAFVAVVLVHPWVPAPVLAVASPAQSLLLGAAMFALGCGVRPAQIRRAGGRPLLLGAIATAWVGGLGLLGATLLG